MLNPLLFALASIIFYPSVSIYYVIWALWSFCIVSESCKLVPLWMVRGKLDCCNSTCRYPVDCFVRDVIICNEVEEHLNGYNAVLSR